MIILSFSLTSCVDPATTDERAVLSAFLPTLQHPDCEPGWTVTDLRQPSDRHWVEADKQQAARIEAALRLAKARNERLPAGSFLGSAISSIYCPQHVRVGTPAFYGGFAFVTAESDNGITTSAYEHKSGKWSWVSATWDGEAIIQY